ncbi:Cell number regulator 7 [Zea mays]|uniref:Cell number regulator 7 n=1 Tax=Zea mays TaxID=4577 RepID=A0A317Y241_MAIZE|nr:Cell number regulator 7 [Zea mays]
MYPAKPTVATASEPVTGMAAPPVTGIPISSPGPAVAASQWSSGLCACFDDCGLCCMTCWCPCVTFGRIAEVVDRGATSCAAAGAIYTLLACFTGFQCHWIYSCTYRSKMRAQLGLPDVGCCDCCVHFCCEPCALCQQYRELRARGLDPALGWDVNAQKAGAGMMYPPAAQGMGR